MFRLSLAFLLRNCCHHQQAPCRRVSPSILYPQKQNATSIFLVPASAPATQVLTKKWAHFLPGARMAPAALHSRLQVNGISFRDVAEPL
ncbi:hypothetical protein R3P38DRAFT_3191467 [Favolaschia claudopus]|uniref:Secreted protein n=1 Tax=Favolaschia claudopus TaxID=2862362 RepID=A0AAW0BLM6_9AGAR